MYLLHKNYVYSIDMLFRLNLNCYIQKQLQITLKYQRNCDCNQQTAMLPLSDSFL